DTDDDSEMDVTECEKRRAECMDNLTDLERQFNILKEQLYTERIHLVEWELTEVKVGRSQEYLQPLQQLEEVGSKEVADKLRAFRIENINHKYESELQAAKQHFEEKAFDQIQDELTEKIRRLKDDRHNVDITWMEWGSDKRSGKVRGPGRKKPVSVQGPYIVYMLHDEEILDDWTTVRKAL
uniref:Breast cancer metastasis-suppressor 1-like protein-A n=1 Tax=Megaselia scalaris TaxID=36166 RepID=T1H654_MEGSC